MSSFTIKQENHITRALVDCVATMSRLKTDGPNPKLDVLMAITSKLNSQSSSELYSGLSVLTEFINNEFEEPSELKETLSAILEGTKDKIFSQSPSSEWKQHIDHYNAVPKNQSGLSQKEAIEQLLPSEESRAKLYEGTVPTQDQDISARTEFLEYLEKVLKALPQSVTDPKEPIDLDALLGSAGTKLYKAAVAEESNSRSFREAVFLSSTQHFKGQKWQADKKLVLWVGGPSASGKTYGASSAVKAMSEHMPTELQRVSDSLMSQLIEIGLDSPEHQKIINNIKRASSTDELANYIDELENKIRLEIEDIDTKISLLQAIHDVKDDLKSSLSAGNNVVSVDGGVEREVSQMRQIVLQAALTRGYKGIGDLHNSTKLGTKSYIKAAALEQKGLNLVIPETFAESMNPLKAFSPEGRYKKTEMERYRDMDNVIQAFSEVKGEPDQDERFQHSVKHMGTSRAWFSEDGDFADIDVRMNNIDIGCESKIYQSIFFHLGKSASNTAHENFKKVEPEGFYLEITNDLIFLQKSVDGNWQECGFDDEPEFKLSNRDYIKWQSLKSEDPNTPELPEWFEQQKIAGELAPALISIKPNDMIRIGTPSGKIPHINMSRRDFEQYKQYRQQTPENNKSLLQWCVTSHHEGSLITPINLLFDEAQYRKLLRVQSAPAKLETPKKESELEGLPLPDRSAPESHHSLQRRPLVSAFHKVQTVREISVHSEPTYEKTQTERTESKPKNRS